MKRERESRWIMWGERVEVCNIGDGRLAGVKTHSCLTEVVRGFK